MAAIGNEGGPLYSTEPDLPPGNTEIDCGLPYVSIVIAVLVVEKIGGRDERLKSTTEFSSVPDAASRSRSAGSVTEATSTARGNVPRFDAGSRCIEPVGSTSEAGRGRKVTLTDRLHTESAFVSARK